jgi:hypothetical protein
MAGGLVVGLTTYLCVLVSSLLVFVLEPRPKPGGTTEDTRILKK